VLPWAEAHHPEACEALLRDYPPDIVTPEALDLYAETSPLQHGDPYARGEYVDPWGAVFQNIQPGVIGEVKEPVIQDWDRDLEKVHVPVEFLSLRTEALNRFCRETDRFVRMSYFPRPFEQLQFLRGTENLYCDLAMEEPRCLEFLQRMHSFYCDVMETWARTEVDALYHMDDWGAQKSLLISPEMWRRFFKPLYREYARIAHDHGKKIMMHSDGNILEIIPDLVENGLDALNCQVFCMGVEALGERFAGRITFWGEIDRQHLLPEGSVGEITAAVRRAAEAFWRGGGAIAQCEFGPGARPETVREVFRAWDDVTA
jgi:hypothetical protein